MHEHPNSLLKVGCLLFIVGGLASALVTLAGLLLSVGSMMDSELYPYVDQMARAQSDGLIGGDEIMAVFSGFVFVMGAIAVIMLIIDLTVGILGLFPGLGNPTAGHRRYWHPADRGGYPQRCCFPGLRRCSPHSVYRWGHSAEQSL